VTRDAWYPINVLLFRNSYTFIGYHTARVTYRVVHHAGCWSL